MQCACLAHLFEFAAQAAHALPDHPAVGLNLGLAGPAEEAKATTLTLKVGPTANKATLLVVEMREFDLQTALGSRRALAEDLEDQSRAVDHLALERFLKIALLDRAERAIDDDELALILLAPGRDVLHLSGPEQRVRLHLAGGQDLRMCDDDTDRERKPFRLL